LEEERELRAFLKEGDPAYRVYGASVSQSMFTIDLRVVSNLPALISNERFQKN
jgi:hypothetical protein